MPNIEGGPGTGLIGGLFEIKKKNTKSHKNIRKTLNNATWHKKWKKFSS